MAANPMGEDALGIDLGTSGGSWLFKDQDLLMGPVPAQVLIDKLHAGEITPDTPIANEDDGAWRTVRDVSFFAVHVARVEARGRVLREKRAVESAERRTRLRRLGIWATLSSILVAAVAAGAWWWVTHDPLQERSEELAALGITVSPPVIALASKSRNLREDGEAFVDVDHVGPAGTKAGDRKVASARSGRRRRAAARAKAPAAKGGAVASTTGAPPPAGNDVGLTPQYDMKHINAVVQQRSRSLFPCIQAEVRRTGFKGTIPFEFVVTNEGRVGRLWIDDRQLRGSPLEACFKETMAKWRFHPFPGMRPTVSQSFTVGG